MNPTLYMPTPTTSERIDDETPDMKTFAARPVEPIPFAPGDYVELGVNGPLGRASGYDIDVRRDHPHAVYGVLDFDVVLGEKVDVFDKALVSILKIFEPIHIHRHYLDQLERAADRSLSPEYV